MGTGTDVHTKRQLRQNVGGPGSNGMGRFGESAWKWKRETRGAPPELAVIVLIPERKGLGGAQLVDLAEVVVSCEAACQVAPVRHQLHPLVPALSMTYRGML